MKSQIWLAMTNRGGTYTMSLSPPPLATQNKLFFFLTISTPHTMEVFLSNLMMDLFYCYTPTLLYQVFILFNYRASAGSFWGGSHFLSLGGGNFPELLEFPALVDP